MNLVILTLDLESPWKSTHFHVYNILFRGGHIFPQIDSDLTVATGGACDKLQRFPLQIWNLPRYPHISMYKTFYFVGVIFSRKLIQI